MRWKEGIYIPFIFREVVYIGNLHKKAMWNYKKLINMMPPMAIHPITQASSTRVDGKESIAVIGGGLGGCLTALMLIKQGYHVTLIEKEDALLKGASRLAARFHAGVEYPKHEESALDLLRSAVTWRLLMPDNIFSNVDPIRAVVGKTSQELGELKLILKQQGRTLTEEQEAKALTLGEYAKSYEKVRLEYERLFKYVQKAMNWSTEKTEQRLLGSYEKEKFCPPLALEEYEDIPGAVGGFQSQERGLNIPKYLAMIQFALEEEVKKGNLALLLGCEVTSYKTRNRNPKQTRKKDALSGENGIRGGFGNFRVYCKKGKERVTVRASQVVEAAHSGGPAITPLCDEGEESREMKVYRRAIMVVDLPEGWKHRAFFKLLGTDEGIMVSPGPDNLTAHVYVLKNEIPYLNEEVLTSRFPWLPENWEDIARSEREVITQRFFRNAVEAYPPLRGATNPRLLVGDTISFQRALYQRRHENVQEEAVNGFLMAPVMQQRQQQLQKQHPEMVMEWKPPAALEHQQGHFILRLTKATHAVEAAVQAAMMVKTRSKMKLEPSLVVPMDPIPVLMHGTLEDPTPLMEKYSLKDMRVPDLVYLGAFCKSHDLPLRLLGKTGLAIEQFQLGKKSTWVKRLKDDGNVHERGATL